MFLQFRLGLHSGSININSESDLTRELNGYEGAISKDLRRMADLESSRTEETGRPTGRS